MSRSKIGNRVSFSILMLKADFITDFKSRLHNRASIFFAVFTMLSISKKDSKLNISDLPPNFLHRVRQKFSVPFKQTP